MVHELIGLIIMTETKIQEKTENEQRWYHDANKILRLTLLALQLFIMGIIAFYVIAKPNVVAIYSPETDLIMLTIFAVWIDVVYFRLKITDKEDSL